MKVSCRQTSRGLLMQGGPDCQYSSGLVGLYQVIIRHALKRHQSRECTDMDRQKSVRNISFDKSCDLS